MFFKEIQLTSKHNTLHSVTRAIQAQSGISFSYNALKIKPETKIKIPAGQVTVQQILKLIKKKTGIGYRVIAPNHFVYTEPEQPKAKPTHISKQAKRRIEMKDINDQPIMLTAVGKDSLQQQQVIIIGDSGVAGYYLAGGGSQQLTNQGNMEEKYPILLDKNSNNNINGFEDLNQLYKSRLKPRSELPDLIKRNLFVAGGLNAEEIFYLNPTLKAGHRFVYGTVNYAISSNYNQIRYGIGSSFSIAENIELALELNFGGSISDTRRYTTTETIPNQEDSTLPPIVVVTPHDFGVSSKLSKAHVIGNYSFGNKWVLSLGFTFNRLTTSYTQNGNSVTPAAMSPVVSFDAPEYRLLSPPYTLSNTYNPGQNNYTKVWIGGQLGFYYRFGLKQKGKN